MEAVITADKLAKHFGRVRAVDGLDLEVRRGDVYGFLGPNGAGKSTTIRMMVGLVRPTSGKVCLFGRDVSRDIRALASVGALVETPAFHKYLTARQNLAVLGRAPASRSETNAVLGEVGLSERADSKVGAYSHGMRQRLGLALAMLKEPELVILDEPTNGLDPQGMQEIRRIIRDLAARRGVTVFLSSHLLHEVEQVCDRVGIISHGRLVAQGSVRELMHADGEAVVTVDRPDEAVEELRALEFVESVEARENSLHVRVRDGKLADLNAFLVGRGFRVSGVVPKVRSLEETYLTIVNGEAGEESSRGTIADADADQNRNI